MRVMRIVFQLVFAASLIVGCASTPPPWREGYLDRVADYYDQGTGSGRSMGQADRYAQIALVGFQQGIQIESITEDQVQSFRQQGDEMIVEVMTSKGMQQIAGQLPAGSYIAERWQDPSGLWWSFALWEKPSEGLLLQEHRNARLRAARRRAVLPGWAQFAKGQNHKAWRILTAGGIGLAGGVTGALLQSEFENRRDRVGGLGDVADDWQYYDDWAHRFYWSSMTFGALAGAAYIYSLVDGWTSLPPTYQLLLSGAMVEPRREGGAALVFTWGIR